MILSVKSSAVTIYRCPFSPAVFRNSIITRKVTLINNNISC